MTMDKQNYQGLQTLVVGMARSGITSALLLDHLEASVTVTDLNPAEKLSPGVAAFPGRIKKILGSHEGIVPSDFDLAVISPGVPWDAPLPTALRNSGVQTISEVELAASLLDAPIIAITGSNGKSTTTALIGAILKQAGHRTFIGGNIGVPLSGAVGGKFDWIVAELSSFQLEGIKKFHPKIALLLNLAPDHLDRHKTFKNYSDIKKKIFENQSEGDTLIVNGLDPLTCDITPPAGVTLQMFGAKEKGGVWQEDGHVFGETDEGSIELFSVDDLLITGSSNVENAMAAASAALSVGVLPEVIGVAITSFTGLPHRMEKVTEFSGVTYINDSKGTNVDATVKSLSGFRKNVVLIAGGSSKGSDYSSLVKAIHSHTKGVVLIGETARNIHSALGGYEPKILAHDMASAIKAATGIADKKGDYVLLSPACASFDMFKNFEARGDAFRDAVNVLSMGRKSNAG